ncbi:cytosine permease [Bacillus shivajii]|uniref:purine-cytosine permease family protein n=1 Tax=Bacillus shivajii TaxID=1983719 RepID=UPI001CFA05C5|nr:cytosine permease [Bacillus shivajii]UCZ54851.1 cytosine permease [Bacillus shivajii]
MSNAIERTEHHQGFTKIERLGLEKVPDHLKTTTAFDYSRIQIAVSVNAGNVLVPALAVLEGGLSFSAAVLSTVIGAVLAFVFVSLLALPGAKYGIPAQYAIRTMVGTKGAMWITSPVRTITSLYWFSVQTIGGAYMLQEILLRAFHIHIPFIYLSLFLAMIMGYLALVGFHMMKKITAFFTPIMFLSAVVMFYVFFTSTPTGENHVAIFQFGSDNSLSMMAFFASLAFVQYVSGVSSSSDLARYGRSTHHAFWGILIGNSVGFTITALLGAYTAAAANHWNPFIITSQWTDSTILLFIIMSAAMMSMITINLNNAYTGGYSLLNSFPSLGRVKSAMIFGAAGVLLSTYPGVIDEAEGFISLLGVFIIPLSAVIVADYTVHKKLNISRNDLMKLADNKNKLNADASYAIVFGMIIYALIPSSYAPGFISFFVTVFTYVCLKYFRTRRR